MREALHLLIGIASLAVNDGCPIGISVSALVEIVYCAHLSSPSWNSRTVHTLAVRNHDFNYVEGLLSRNHPRLYKPKALESAKKFSMTKCRCRRSETHLAANYESNCEPQKPASIRFA